MRGASVALGKVVPRRRRGIAVVPTEGSSVRTPKQATDHARQIPRCCSG